MRLALWCSLLVPVACMLMALRRRKYVWNCVLTLSCAAIVLCTNRGAALLPLVIGLCVSVIGDFFMAHKAQRSAWYVAGISGFLVAHLCYIWYATPLFVPEQRIIYAGVALVCLVGWYFATRVLPKVQGIVMKVAVAVYALASFASLILAAGIRVPEFERILYAFGIACIVASDTMIAESDFVGNKQWSPYIMPTYYLCHILIAASAVAGMTI